MLRVDLVAEGLYFTQLKVVQYTIPVLCTSADDFYYHCSS
jgi:hypothetical protein